MKMTPTQFRGLMQFLEAVQFTPKQALSLLELYKRHLEKTEKEKGNV